MKCHKCGIECDEEYENGLCPYCEKELGGLNLNPIVIVLLAFLILGILVGLFAHFFVDIDFATEQNTVQLMFFVSIASGKSFLRKA